MIMVSHKGEHTLEPEHEIRINKLEPTSNTLIRLPMKQIQTNAFFDLESTLTFS